MVRGTKNETVTLNGWVAFRMLHALYEIGILGLKDMTYSACSPDAVALLHHEVLRTYQENREVEWEQFAGVNVGGIDWPLYVVYIKTVVSRRNLDPLLAEVSGDVKLVDLCSREVR